MTTPAGVPNLPVGALTVSTLHQKLQDQTAEAMRARAGEQMPSIFGLSTGGDIMSDISPFGILTNIWAGLNSLIANSDPADIQGPNDLPPLLLDFIEGLPVIGQFVQLLEAIVGTYDGDDTTLQSIRDLLAPIVEFFTGVIDTTGSIANWAASLISGGLSTVMQTLETFLTGIPNLSTWLTGLRAWIDGLLSLNIGNLSTFLTTFKTFITGLLGITNLSTWVDGLTTLVTFFNNLVTTFGTGLWTVLTEIVQHFIGVFTGAGSVGTWLTNISSDLLAVAGGILNTTVTSVADALYKLTGWRQTVPNLEGLISGILHPWVNPLTNTNNTLVDLKAWATNLLTSTSVLPSFNLNGVIPAELLALIGVGNIGNVAPNLITDAGFGSAAALQAGVGWTWDAGVNSTGSTGGAAKLACDGGVKYMFSNLIAAAPKQQLTVSVKTKYTKANSAQANIIAAVRTYKGETVRSTDTVAYLAATGTTSVGTTGADTAGFVTITGTYTVPDNVDSVRLVLGVTTGPAGTTVWFDEASLAKTSLLPQDLIHNLGGTLEALLPLEQFNTLLDSVADQTGATIQQVKDVLDGKLTVDSQLNGTNITVGNISAEVIEELRLTWEKLGGSVQGATGTPPTTITGLAAEFASLINGITALSSLIGGNSGDIFRIGNTVSGHTTTIAGLDSTIQSYASSITTQFNKLSSDNSATALTVSNKLDEYEKRIWNLEHPTSTQKPVTTTDPVYVPPPVPPPTPPAPAPAPPTPVSVSDDFERASLGSAWALTSFNTNGSTLDILNSHDAFMFTPTASLVENRIAAVYAGAGSASIGEYQKISATLGTKAGVPLVGSAGYNDLIGRAANGLRCVFCRFYPTGRVQFGYRNGNWTDQIVGDFQLGYGKNPAAGSSIEFYVGDKTAADQTKLTAKVGTTTIGPAYIPADVLATMGKGWGFLLGHGLSIGNFTFGYGAPQVPGTLNLWSAQEQ